MEALSQSGVRVGVFAAVFCAMAVWECIAPRRTRVARRGERWPGNVLVAVIGAVVVRLISPLGAVGVARFAAGEGIGLSYSVGQSAVSWFAGSFVALDLAVYLQHRAFHTFGPLWRLHKIHHADHDVDVTTGARFHPIEILISLGVKAGVILALGASPGSVMAFEIVLNAAAMFNHANVRLPLGVDRILRRVLVTPDMHRVHHSVDAAETGRNFGFNLPVWDRLFGTYKAGPDRGHEGMIVGIPEYRDETRTGQILWLLSAPFR